MSLQDEERERQRLSRVYGDMSDAELLRLAADPVSLTDAALDAIEEEAERRGLKLDVEVNEPVVSPAYGELAVVRQFRDLPEALLAKGALEAAGIESHLLDENLVRLDWFYSNAIGGVRLCVRVKDASAAFRILNQPVDSSPLDDAES